MSNYRKLRYKTMTYREVSVFTLDIRYKKCSEFSTSTHHSEELHCPLKPSVLQLPELVVTLTLPLFSLRVPTIFHILKSS